jgi:hypothetical protein
LGGTRIELLATGERRIPALGWHECRVQQDGQSELFGSVLAFALRLQ